MDSIPLDGKRVIVRVDFNVTVGDDNKVDESEDYRIETALPTILELQRRRCKILLLSHLGRPGEEDGNHDMAPVHRRLEELLREEVRLLPKLYGQGVETIVASMEPGAVALYPNVRLDDRELSTSDKLGADIAQVGEAYVNEAFSVCHRAHTSVTVIPRLLPSAAGRRTVLEIAELSKLVSESTRPYIAIVSGAKITTKIGMLRQLLQKVDTLCVGGQIANVFIAAAGHWPAHCFGVDEIEAAKALVQTAGHKLLIPVDVYMGEPDGKNSHPVALQDIPPECASLWDIGPKSAEQILNVCTTAKTIMWNGPVGKFEIPAYSHSTKDVALELARAPAYRVVGGGDTVNALEQFRLIEKYDHVSVGGGAMIAFLEGKRMPGLEPLYS